VTFLVFSQEPGCPPFERLATHGARFFSTVLELLEQTEESIVVRLICSRPALRGDFRIASRPTTRDDLMNAREAEARGRAGGMAALAEKCKQIWTIEGVGEESPLEAARLTHVIGRELAARCRKLDRLDCVAFHAVAVRL